MILRVALADSPEPPILPDLEEAIAEERDRLSGVFYQRGVDGLIVEAADDLAKLRRMMMRQMPELNPPRDDLREAREIIASLLNWGDFDCEGSGADKIAKKARAWLEMHP